jgi:hypothetical protein
VPPRFVSTPLPIVMFLSEAPYWSKPPRDGFWSSHKRLAINVISDGEYQKLTRTCQLLQCGCFLTADQQQLIGLGQCLKCFAAKSVGKCFGQTVGLTAL